MTKTASILETLLERLYLAKRELQSNGIDDPHFVLVARDEAKRHQMEKVLFAHMAEKYGFDWSNLKETAKHYDVFPGTNQSTFLFAEHGFRITIIKLKW